MIYLEWIGMEFQGISKNYYELLGITVNSFDMFL